MGSYGEIYSSEVKECDGKGVWKINGNTRTFRGKWIANKDIYKKYFSKTIQALTHFLQFFLIFKIYYLIFFFLFCNLIPHTPNIKKKTLILIFLNIPFLFFSLSTPSIICPNILCFRFTITSFVVFHTHSQKVIRNLWNFLFY